MQEKEKHRDRKSKKKWKLWRSSSEGLKRVQVASSDEFSDYSFSRDDAFAAAMATVVRAPPRDFMVIKQEWAAIRIQAAFRGLLVCLLISFSDYFSVDSSKFSAIAVLRSEL